MDKRLMLIVNPAAGRGAYKKGFADALHALDKGGMRTTVYWPASAATAP